MERYDSYKDSGAEWIGEIPEGWKNHKLLYALSMPVTDGPHETPTFYQEGIPFVSADAVKGGQIVFSRMRGYISYEYHLQCAKKYSPELGDILMIKSGATTGQLAFVDFDDIIFDIWSPLAAIRTNRKHVAKYLFYALSADYFQKQVEDAWSFGTQQNLSMRKLEQLIVVFPSDKSQEKAIADYLDHKTSQIDSLIVKTERAIELLGEYRKSVISEVVTKGLDPNVAMKDSGVEWIGEIPEGWRVLSLKWVLGKPLQYGANESGVPYEISLPRYIRITDIDEKGTLKSENAKSLPEQIAEDYILNDGDVLFARSGATVGKAFLYRNSMGKSAFAGYLIRVCPNKEQLHSKYLLYWTQSVQYENWKMSIYSIATIQNIGAEKYSQLPLVMPSIETQSKIVIYLDQKTAEIDSLIEKKKQVVEKLQEYRKSLISECVTGKIKVPGVE